MANRSSRSTPRAPRRRTPESDANQAAAYGARIVAADVAEGALYWKAVEVRHLSADENRGKHNVFVKALDEQGNRLRAPSLRIAWTWEGRKADEQAAPKALDKRDGELGHGDVDLYKGQRAEVWLEGDGLPSDHVANLHTDHEQAELTADGQDGNTRFHHSFLVVFRRTRKAAGESAAAPQSTPATNGQTTPAPVDAAAFVREEDTTPDGTTLQPGTRFAKQWVVRNTGSTTWGEGYHLVAVEGDRLGAPPNLSVPPTPPGAEARITADFTAPATPGPRRTTWQLADSRGRRFGDPLWADITVAAPTAGAASPPPPDALALPAGASPEAQAVAQIWSRYGGLVQQEAARLGIDPAAAVAVLATESRGEPFAADGRMTIRFENHLFFKFWGAEHEDWFDQHFAFDPDTPWQGHTWRPTPQGPMHACHTGHTQEWQVFEFARSLDETAALKSISMGAPQIMGFNHAAIGYATPQAMFAAFAADAGAQLRALFRFIEVNGLVEAVRREDYLRFATAYNGSGRPGYYAGLMRNYATTFAGLRGRTVGPRDDSTPRTPQPTSPKPGVPLSEADPELYAAWRQHIENGFKHNDTMFRRVLDAFMNPYWTTVWMYRILFGVGVSAFVVAALVALIQNNPVTTLVFGGLSVAAFLGYFVSRPLQALEENLQFITWLGIIYNTYWSRLVQAQDPATYAAELDEATDDAIQRIQTLMDKHKERSGARPSL